MLDSSSSSAEIRRKRDIDTCSGGTVKLLVDKGFWDSLGSGWGGCGAVVRQLWGSVR
jgi:hypothetical protein